MPEVHIAYPTPDGVTVPGGGAFFAWGTLDGLIPETAQALIDGESAGQKIEPPPSPSDWAFRFEDVSKEQHTLTIQAWDDMELAGDPVEKSIEINVAGIAK
jgi:hypothetical protein